MRPEHPQKSPRGSSGHLQSCPSGAHPGLAPDFRVPALTQLHSIASPHTSTLRGSQASGAAALLAAHRGPRVRRPHALRAALTVHVVRDLTQVRAVRALDGGGGSRSSSDKLPRVKAQGAAAAKLSMRSPRVTRSTASTDPDGACCKPAVGARPRPAQSLHTGALTNGRCSADVLGGSSTRSPRHLGPACKETWDHLRHVRPRAVRRSWWGNGGGDRCHEGAARGAVCRTLPWLAERSAHRRFVGCR